MLTMRSTQHLLTYAAICPHPPDTSTNSPHLTDQLYLLEETLQSLLSNPALLHSSNPAALINYCEFGFPNVNDYDENLCFIVDGLDPNLALGHKPHLDDVRSQREIAIDIFRAFQKTYATHFPKSPLPPSLTAIRDNDRLAISSLLSVKRFHPKESPKALIAVAMSANNAHTADLKLAITTLCVTNKQQLSIGGQIININLLPPPTTPPEQTSSHPWHRTTRT